MSMYSNNTLTQRTNHESGNVIHAVGVFLDDSTTVHSRTKYQMMVTTTAQIMATMPIWHNGKRSEEWRAGAITIGIRCYFSPTSLPSSS
jgi:hypothetical protein